MGFAETLDTAPFDIRLQYSDIRRKNVESVFFFDTKKIFGAFQRPVSVTCLNNSILMHSLDDIPLF